MWTIDLFVKDNGRCPTQDFLDKLSPSADLPYIRKRFGQLEEHGYKLDRPLAAHLGDGIYELRIKTINGQFRFFYFFYVGNTIVVTHGAKKKTNQVPASEKEQAIACRKIYYARYGMKP